MLEACREVENGLVVYHRSQEAAVLQADAIEDVREAVALVLMQYQAGKVAYPQVLQIQQALVQQPASLAETQGQIATGLIGAYRALGGGWQIRCNGCNTPTLDEAKVARVAATNPVRSRPYRDATNRRSRDLHQCL